jgi:gamma-glutamyltranspeptidase/glutathione hydrolase
MAFQLMGGSQQAQGHMQVLVNMFDLGANLQAATDMARFSHDQASDRLQLESQLFNLVGPQLQALGHTNTVSANGSPMGGYQAILFTPDPLAAEPSTTSGNSHGNQPHPQPVNGYYRAGSDHRKDGEAVGWESSLFAAQPRPTAFVGLFSLLPCYEYRRRVAGAGARVSI